MSYPMYGIAVLPPENQQVCGQCFARGLIQETIVGRQQGLDMLCDWACKALQRQSGKIKEIRVSGCQDVIVLDLLITGDGADEGVGIK